MVEIRIKGLETSDDFLEEVSKIKRAYNFAFDRFAHSIREAELLCADVNGPRGGLDKTCLLQLRLFPKGVLTAKSSGFSFIEAAKNSCEKVKSMLSKKLSKSKTSLRKGYAF